MDICSFQEVNKLCTASGFTKRGKAFFRIVGDGVLQVIKCKYQRTLCADVIYIGLFSMYDSLQPQWFTASGCVTRYSVINCFNQNNMPLIFAVPLHTQLDMFSSKVIPWLDMIDTQKKLSRAIWTLDCRWNDGLKIGPYLACGELNHAKKVLREILAQHNYAQVNRLQFHEDTDGLWVLDKEQEDDDLHRLFAMIDRGDHEEIDHYLKSNYARNMSYATFCTNTPQERDAKRTH